MLPIGEEVAFGLPLALLLHKYYKDINYDNFGTGPLKKEMSRLGPLYENVQKDIFH